MLALLRCPLSGAAPPWPLALQEKRSSYAPTDETPVRYDGIYRIVKCWRTKGKQVRHRQLPRSGAAGCAGSCPGAGWQHAQCCCGDTQKRGCKSFDALPASCVCSLVCMRPSTRLRVRTSPQGFLMCRYLFVRCDNEPAPWSSDGGRPEARACGAAPPCPPPACCCVCSAPGLLAFPLSRGAHRAGCASLPHSNMPSQDPSSLLLRAACRDGRPPGPGEQPAQGGGGGDEGGGQGAGLLHVREALVGLGRGEGGGWGLGWGGSVCEWGLERELKRRGTGRGEGRFRLWTGMPELPSALTSAAPAWHPCCRSGAGPASRQSARRPRAGAQAPRRRARRWAWAAGAGGSLLGSGCMPRRQRLAPTCCLTCTPWPTKAPCTLPLFASLWQVSEQEKALREFACGICKNVVSEPVSTPCGERARRVAEAAVHPRAHGTRFSALPSQHCCHAARAPCLSACASLHMCSGA